jgi:hypothetical protein
MNNNIDCFMTSLIGHNVEGVGEVRRSKRCRVATNGQCKEHRAVNIAQPARIFAKSVIKAVRSQLSLFLDKF